MESRREKRKEEERGDAFLVEHLSFAYDSSEAVLRDLSFRIRRGKITTLMGANGCGKSTLFHLLTKNLKPVLGNIYCKGRNLEEITLRDFARNVAIVHQHNAAPPDMTVHQLVRYGRTPYRDMLRGHAEREEEEKRVTNAMKITGVYPLRDRPVERLSGGQKQRAFLSMALAQDTDILLLDEPTTYLDIRYQLEILRLIRRINRAFGITIVMVLHDINQAIRYSDEIIAMSPRGTLLAGGPAESVMNEALIRRIYGVELKMCRTEEGVFVLTV